MPEYTVVTKKVEAMQIAALRDVYVTELQFPITKS